MENVSQLARLGLFDARVPRYTSYPTAPHFSPKVGSEHFSGWIERIPAGTSISLYLHIPFCRRLCWFCACRTQGTRTDAPVAAYVEALKAEIALFHSRLAPGVTLSRMHWGGGTPTLLGPAMIEDLAGAVLTRTPLAEGAEFSVEIDPNEIDGPRLDALARAGMNRASIGVQDFDETIQKAIGRIQSFEITARTVEMIRARGIPSVNADILYGLPHQTPRRMADSAHKLLALGPDRVALYGYAHVPWMSRRQQLIPSDALPTPQERLRLFETARRIFAADGYEEIGVDHFALPGDGLAIARRTGRLRRNFQGYTDDRSEILVGLGASSISRFPQGYAQNAPVTSEWHRAIAEGGFATRRGHVFSDEDRLRGRMIEAVMCDFAISRREMLALAPHRAEMVEALFADASAAFGDMVEVTEAGLTVPAHARPLARMIARAFDGYDLSKAGHSSAV